MMGIMLKNASFKRVSSLALLLTVLSLGLLFLLVYSIGELVSENVPIWLAVSLIFYRIALFFWFFQTVGFWFLKLVAAINPKLHNSYFLQGQSHQPKVSIIIPIRDEPDDVIKRMVAALKNIDYPCFEIIIVDNSSSPMTKEMVQNICNNMMTLRIARKPDTKGFKAGALNFALSQLDSQVKYFLVLDIDHAPQSNILKSLVSIMESNEKIAFVQAPQRYDNAENKLLSQAFCYMQRIFYDHVCPGLFQVNSLFMSGTNMLVRKSSIDEIGGFDESSLTEDIRTSLILHKKGWLGIYHQETVAIGYPPFNMSSYHKQQRRWAIGTFQNFFESLYLFFKQPSALSIEQWLVYLGWNGTYYFQGFCNIVLAWASLGLVFTGIANYIVFFDILVMSCSSLTLLYQMKMEHDRYKTSYLTLMLSHVIFFGNSIVYVMAFVDLLIKRNIDFQVTGKSDDVQQRPSRAFTCYHLALLITSVGAILFSLFNGSIYLSTLIWVLFSSFQSAINLALYFESNLIGAE
ncbi:MAG: glycosyltransferase [Negativicutes bacterium]